MAAARQKTPGRPQASTRGRSDPRQALVRTAAELIARQGFEGTSLRQVAEGAGVTPAMVAYYFKDKSGLLEAVVRMGLGTMLGVVQASVADHEPGTFVARLIPRYMAALANEPWIPQIMIREVISRESPLRQLFIEEFAIHAAAAVPERVMEEISQGALRDDLEPRFLILSLLGMCLFPFIAEPVLGPLLGFSTDEHFAADYGAHVLELFNHGAGVQS